MKEWELYYSVEPFGEMQGYAQAAIIACVIANVNRDAKKRPQPFTPEDFMPQFEKETEEQKMNKIKKVMSGMVGRFVSRETGEEVKNIG